MILMVLLVQSQLVFGQRTGVRMIGELTVIQEALFYSFSIENHVLADHLWR